MMLIITFLAHFLILYIAPTQNVLITSSYITNAVTTSYSEIDTAQLIMNTMLKTFPLTLIICIVISFIFSLFFSRSITTPILSIVETVNKMTKLDKSSAITVNSTDEIGLLAENINSLYQSLITTIHHLEIEKENVSLAEKEKINFFRLASHELKTPITELNATLDNMILGIGEYQKYDIYLPKCKKITEQLGNMVNKFLSASRLHDNDKYSFNEISLKAYINKVCEPFKLIAEKREIRFNLITQNDIIVSSCESLLEKALSNILLNAVNYTQAGKKITVTLHENILSISNECTPIPEEDLVHIFEPFYRSTYLRNHDSEGNGLGLYIVDTILQKLELKYEFNPISTYNGMIFSIQFTNLNET